MKFVEEKIIDKVVEELDGLSDEQYEQRMESLAEAQPVLFAWLFSEQFELLSEDEKGYLQYLALIAWNSIVKANGGPVAIPSRGLPHEKIRSSLDREGRHSGASAEEGNVFPQAG